SPIPVSSAISLDLPIPGSPSMTSIPPGRTRAAASAALNSSRSRERPTNAATVGVPMATLSPQIRGRIDEAPDVGRRRVTETAAMQTESIHPAVRVGHVELRVADLDRAIGFYRDGLGFNLVADGRRAGIDTVFLAAGDYHHHIALSAWTSANP